MVDDDDEEKKWAAVEAEARRKRIMDKSKDRMNKVSGLQREADEETEETKASSSARIQAMRKRRFKKGAKTKAAEEESTDTEKILEVTADAPAALAGAGDKLHVNEQVTEEEKPLAVEPAKDHSSNRVEPADTEATTEVRETESPAVEGNVEENPSTTEPTKKYKGVAKMRREKMLQKKKEEAAKASESPSVTLRKKRVKQPLLPIFMYILTTVLLFLAGLDVGLQHADPEYIMVNREFSPREFTLKKFIPWSSTTISGPVKDLDTAEGRDLYARDLTKQSDEFDGVGYHDVDYVPNIDPLFRVDLDEVTRGPGVVNQLGRGAVKIHRMVLYVLLELPSRLLSLPVQLFRYPPVLCLAALSIRQLIAKVVLGAALPDAIAEDVRTTKEMADILTMIKNAVKNTLAGAFPTAVTAVEVFQQLRVDMYVVLCGVFVGLLYSTWTPSEEGMQGLVIPDPAKLGSMAEEL